ncbi:hypothetical protein QEV83_07555 [Methylocapsa sp. D3K7]|uniref:hypothetical protein n=1 Tax=Methylocapsa sp. D3K7 TaxID=3041435 RepID=UPI00244EC13A|nr:hypothetical protein [Methylocapsa sp. D3K7]WGJ16089.1 hypothetical protein QEV83_07555 [Methylocapsa sp. D3K7]
MTARTRIGGPAETVRPFIPDTGVTDIEEQKTEALEHIARALSAIDHNLELVAQNSKEQTELLGRIASAMKFK